nr:Flowering time control protein like [Ipomoea batatas]
MDLLFGFQPKPQDKTKILLIDDGDAHFLAIRLHNSWILKLLGAVILALVIVSFPWLCTMIGESWHEPGNISDAQMVFDPISVDLLPHVFHDLANEGLLRQGDRALFLSSNGDEEAIYGSRVISDYNMDLVTVSDIQRQRLIPEETYDFAFAHGLTATSDFVNRALKVGGIVVLQLTGNPAVGFKKPPGNSRIVYLRKFESAMIVTMKKTGANSTPLGIESEARVAALKNLEDVLLEPPRAASGKSNSYIKRTRYLPDLMGVSLESYPRRVFIDASLRGNNDASAWFTNHYPSGNSKFEIFQVEVVADASGGGGEVPVISMSDWVGKNVEEKDYVVMKTEVEVAEEMVRSRAIKLVDELFLECKHQGIKKGGEKNRRAYWECLALYGLLRDEGVAVHQWWG